VAISRKGILVIKPTQDTFVLGEKAHTSKRVSIIACNDVISKVQCAPNVHSTFVFLPRKNRPGYGRLFVVWIYCFLLKNALLILLPFVEKCLVDIIAFC